MNPIMAQNQVKSLHTKNERATSDRYRLWALALLTFILVALCIWLTIPFLPAVTWGVALAIIAWPMHRWLSSRISYPNVAAAASTLVVVIGILGPGIWVGYRLASEARNAAQSVQTDANGHTPVRDTLVQVPGIRQVVAWMEQLNVDVETEARTLIRSYTQNITDLAQGSVNAAIQFLLAVFILFFIFKERQFFLTSIRELLPMAPAESDHVFRRFEDSVHANVYATLITSVIDATGGGLMFWLLGLPAPFIWAAVMFVLSLLPIVGAGLVWGPAVIYLALVGQWLGAVGLLAWGLLSFFIVDNILYVRLAGKRMRMHPVPALIAFLGGLALFGVSGMILGPAILAVTIAVLDVWRERVKTPAAESA